MEESVLDKDGKKKEIIFSCFKWLNIGVLSVLFVSALHFGSFKEPESFGIGTRFLDVLLFALAVLWWEFFERLVSKKRIMSGKKPYDFLVPNLVSALVLSLFVFALLLATKSKVSTSAYVTLVFGLTLFGALSFADRVLSWSIERFFTVCPLGGKRILVVGTGRSALSFINEVGNKRSDCYLIPAILDVESRESFVKDAFPELNFLNVDKLIDILREQVIDEVYVFIPLRSYYDLVTQIITECITHGIPVKLNPTVDIQKLAYQAGIGTVWDDEKDGIVRIMTGSPLLDNPFHMMVKRIFDVIIAWILVIIISPVMLCAALAVKLTSPGPIIFRQKRVGKGKRVFTLYKFRTMYEDAEARLAELEGGNITHGAAFKMENDPRITPVGRFLRKTSIDELPQLFNVIKGDMSLVGPRPLPLRDYERFYDDKHRRRFAVTPGITGLWQVSGRSNMSFDDWMALDLFYIDNWSLKLDLSILWKTLGVVLRGSGAM